jgi:hypothetical protein
MFIERAAVIGSAADGEVCVGCQASAFAAVSAEG